MSIIVEYPRLFLACVVVSLGFAVLLAVFDSRSDGADRREAYDKAHLACRRSGGSFEDFRSQGYVCIHPKETGEKPE